MTDTAPQAATTQPATTPPRDLGIDLLRGACILYIVGYWHLFNYTYALPKYVNWFTMGLTYAALATFTFCSGYLLAGRTVKLTPGPLWTFYRRRLLRIYPLYALALVLMGLYGIANWNQVTDGLLLISMFDPPAMPTLWFITMIMVFYLIAPLLIQAAERPPLAVALTLALMAGLVGWHLWSKPLDLRILVYLPAFTLGILYRRQAPLRAWCERYRWWLLVAALVLLRTSLMGSTSRLPDAIALIPLLAISPLALFLFANPVARWLHGPTILWLAYCSFGLYLFHRLVFKASIDLYYPQDVWHQAYYLWLVGLPVSLLLAYGVQRGYDALLARRATPKTTAPSSG